MSQTHILTLVGARPQFIKAAVLARYLRQLGKVAPMRETLVHSGQHYDANMSQIFFDELAITPAKYNLDVGSASASTQIARIIERFDPIVADEKPDGVLVYGDTNSTLAAAIVTTRHDIPLIHVEAGERLFRRHHVPEESNRIVTDSLAALCLTASTGAMSYLQREGYAPQRIHFVGDPMYDLFLFIRQRIEQEEIKTQRPADFGLQDNQYILATVHRAENTQTIDQIQSLFQALDDAPMPVLLPLHPRVAYMIRGMNWQPKHQLKLIDALGYPDLIRLLLSSDRVFTDSGGLQREAFFARKPAIVPLADTPWQNLVEAGWVHLVKNDAEAIHNALHTFAPLNAYPEGLFGDGTSSQKIVDAIVNYLPIKEEPAWHYRGSIAHMPTQRPSTFTYHNYDTLLARLKQLGYTIESLRLVHPVAFDLASAVQLAQVEAKHGFMATYFILADSDRYNPFSQRNATHIQQILALGHRLGIYHEQVAPSTSTSAHLLADHYQTQITYQMIFAQADDRPTFSALDAQATDHDFETVDAIIVDRAGGWNPMAPLAYQHSPANKTLMIVTHPVLWRSIPSAPTGALHQWLTENIEMHNTAIDRWT